MRTHLRAVSLILASLAAQAAGASPKACVRGSPGYRFCVEERIRASTEGSAGRSLEAAPLGRAPLKPPMPIAPSQIPIPAPPPRRPPVGPTPEMQFGIDADALRARIDRKGPAAPAMTDIERELQRLSTERPVDPAARNRRDFEIDQLRRRAEERRLFADPPGTGGSAPR
jgi:hypothetical protein